MESIATDPDVGDEKWKKKTSEHVIGFWLHNVMANASYDLSLLALFGSGKLFQTTK